MSINWWFNDSNSRISFSKQRSSVNGWSPSVSRTRMRLKGLEVSSIIKKHRRRILHKSMIGCQTIFLSPKSERVAKSFLIRQISYPFLVAFSGFRNSPLLTHSLPCEQDTVTSFKRADHLRKGRSLVFQSMGFIDDKIWRNKSEIVLPFNYDGFLLKFFLLVLLSEFNLLFWKLSRCLLPLVWAIANLRIILGSGELSIWWPQDFPGSSLVL